MPLSNKSQFSVRVLTSIKERIRAKSKRTGESINSIATRWLLLGEKADKADKANDKVKG